MSDYLESFELDALSEDEVYHIELYLKEEIFDDILEEVNNEIKQKVSVDLKSSSENISAEIDTNTQK